jgi:uncharacterized membrane protein
LEIGSSAQRTACRLRTKDTMRSKKVVFVKDFNVFSLFVIVAIILEFKDVTLLKTLPFMLVYSIQVLHRHVVNR